MRKDVLEALSLPPSLPPFPLAGSVCINTNNMDWVVSGGGMEGGRAAYLCVM